MSSMRQNTSGQLGFDEFQKAVNDAAIIKSKFYDEMKTEIDRAIARYRVKMDKDGKPVFVEGDPVFVENTTDEMIAAIFSIGMRGNYLHTIDDPFIKRVERGAYYARVLEEYADTEKQSASLKEKVRIDVAIVVKNILPDMTRIQTPVFAGNENKMANYAGSQYPTGGFPKPGK